MSSLPTWPPRVKPYLIRQLYESDAQGALDADLLDEVGWALYSRCDSFLLAQEAFRGSVRCPQCRTPVPRQVQPKEILRCPACGWECAHRAFMESLKDQQLSGGPEVVALFQGYLDAFPKAKAPAEKMLLIDGLIHSFHLFLRSGRPGRPVAINLINGPQEFVINFLDHLSAGPASTPGVQESMQEWRKKMHK
jgi:hypothetical protein